MQVNDAISIITGSAFNAVSGTMPMGGLRGEVTAVTEKAVQITAKTRNGKPVNAWFPKKALRVLGADNYPGTNETLVVTEMAAWFRPTGWTAKFMQLTEGLL